VLIGQDKYAKFNIENKKREKLFNQMIPCQVFALLPIKLENEQWAWLQNVWRFTHFKSAVDKDVTYVYTLTEKAAWDLTRNYHPINTSNQYDDTVAQAARKRLG